MSEMQITPLFPTFLFRKDHADPVNLNAQLLEASHRVRAQHSRGVAISNQGGCRSKDGVYSTNPEFASFVGFVEEAMVEVKEFL